MLSGDIQYFIIDNIPLLWIVLLLDIEDRQPPTGAGPRPPASSRQRCFIKLSKFDT